VVRKLLFHQIGKRFCDSIDSRRLLYWKLYYAQLQHYNLHNYVVQWSRLRDCGTRGSNWYPRVAVSSHACRCRQHETSRQISFADATEFLGRFLKTFIAIKSRFWDGDLNRKGLSNLCFNAWRPMFRLGGFAGSFFLDSCLLCLFLFLFVSSVPHYSTRFWPFCWHMNICKFLTLFRPPRLSIRPWQCLNLLNFL